MRLLKSATTIVFSIVILAIVSCNKTNDSLVETNISKQVTGNYEGTLTKSNSTNTNPAKTDITSYNDYTIQVHCYGADIDTTFLLELYPDGSMMRVCFTNDDFYSEYGHNQSENHHMMGGEGDWTNWNQHMSNDHDANDEHYGFFNTDNHEFDYTFNMESSSGNYTQRFVGTKQ